MQRKLHRLAAVSLAIALSAGAVSALAASVMVGGAPMLPTKDIIDNAVNSKDHTTLVAAVKAAGLVDTLKGPGPFTVFAPTNAAFAALPAGTVDTLLKPENKRTLTGVLTYHVVAGKLDAAALKKRSKAGKGTAELKTVAGGTLVAKEKERQDHPHRRERRHRHGDDPQRLPVERRDPRGQQSAAPQTKQGAPPPSRTPRNPAPPGLRCCPR